MKLSIPVTAAAVAFILFVSVGLLRAMSPRELERYGYSRQFSKDRSLSSSRKSARSETLNPDEIPDPALPRLAPRETGVPKPVSRNGRLLPLPVLKKSPKSTVKLPPPAVPPGKAGIVFKRIGDKACLACHKGYSGKARRGHGGLLKSAVHFRAVKKKHGPKAGCESCHGPGNHHARTGKKKYIFSFTRASFAESNRVCLDCHYMKKALNPDEWRFSGHGRARIKCIDCHSEHSVKRPPMLSRRINHQCLRCHRQVESMFTLRSHHPVKDEGFRPLGPSPQQSSLKCTDCHDPHRRRDSGGRTAKRRHSGCLRCHPGRRGPFFYEHRVRLDRRDKCLTCHLPHGSPNRDLLIVKGRGLCLRCHADRISHNPTMTCYTSSCHGDIHGSNHSALFIRR